MAISLGSGPLRESPSALERAGLEPQPLVLRVMTWLQSFPMPDISNPVAILLAQAVVSRSDLRWEFANIAAAVALVSVAFAAIALFCFRRGTRDLTLIYVSVFCVFYAVRVLASLPSFRSLFDESPKFWNYLGWLVSSTSREPYISTKSAANASALSFAGFSSREQCTRFSRSSLPLLESVWPRSASPTTSRWSPRWWPP